MDLQAFVASLRRFDATVFTEPLGITLAMARNIAFAIGLLAFAGNLLAEPDSFSHSQNAERIFFGVTAFALAYITFEMLHFALKLRPLLKRNGFQVTIIAMLIVYSALVLCVNTMTDRMQWKAQNAMQQLKQEQAHRGHP